MTYYQVEVFLNNEWSAVKELHRGKRGSEIHVIYDSTERLTYEEATARHNVMAAKYHGETFRVAKVNY